MVHIYGPEVITSGEGLVPPEEWVFEPDLPDDGRRARETLVEVWGFYWTDEMIRWLVRERCADQPSAPAASHKTAPRPRARLRPKATAEPRAPSVNRSKPARATSKTRRAR